MRTPNNSHFVHTGSMGEAYALEGRELMRQWQAEGKTQQQIADAIRQLMGDDTGREDVTE